NPEGLPYQRASVDRAKQAGLVHEACVSSANLASELAARLEFDEALEVSAAALAIADDHELLYRRNCLLITRCDALLFPCQWDQAVADATFVLMQSDLATHHRSVALRARGTVLARRGEPGAIEALVESLDLALAFGEAQFIATARIAYAEAAWLAGDG